MGAFKMSGVQLGDTEGSTLAACADNRARLILEYRSQRKLEASINGLLKAVGMDERIHARFNPTGSLTGRFSSKGPNLQKEVNVVSIVAWEGGYSAFHCRENRVFL